MKNVGKRYVGTFKRLCFVVFALYYACLSAFILHLFTWKKKRVEASYSTEGQAECVMELHSRRILFEQNADVRLPMASTTKILTAITVLERCGEIKREVDVADEAIGIEGSSVYLNREENYTVEDLLYGLMLRSGNDCAVALAYYISGGVEKFSAEMNKTAQKAGALCSNFVNPHGLPQKNHYTTAKDLTSIACYAMYNTEFSKIVSTKYYSNKHWQNKNKLLYNYEGCCGIKTGYTKQAGRCLVSAAEKNGMTLVCTLLNCPTTYERTTQLFDDAFERYEYYQIVQAGQQFDLFKDGKVVKAQVLQSFSYPVLEEEKEYLQVEAIAIEKRENFDKNGEILGQIQIFLSKRLLFLANLYKL